MVPQTSSLPEAWVLCIWDWQSHGHMIPPLLIILSLSTKGMLAVKGKQAEPRAGGKESY